MRRFKLPPIGHLKRFEGCRLAAQSNGTLGYSNAEDSHSSDDHSSLKNGRPALRIVVKNRPPKEDVGHDAQLNHSSVTRAPTLLERAQVAMHQPVKLKRKEREEVQ